MATETVQWSIEVTFVNTGLQLKTSLCKRVVVSPLTLTWLVMLSSPAIFCAVQLYIPVSSMEAPLTSSVPSSSIETLSVPFNCCPSLLHVTSGCGEPLTGHLMLRVVSVNMVILSPIFISTGVLSSATVVLLVLGKSIDGMTSSAGVEKGTKA